MIEVELPDGTIIEFPEGTPPEEMERVAAEASGVTEDYGGLVDTIMGWGRAGVGPLAVERGATLVTVIGTS